MATLYQFLLYSHIAVGFVSLITFWIPIFAKKGSPLHVRTGHWYAKSMYAVGITAVVLAALIFLDPLGTKYPNNDFEPAQAAKVIAEIKDIGVFLFAIAVLTITNVRTGLLSLRAKRNHAELRSYSNLSLNALLLSVGLYLIFRATGGSPLSVLFYIFAGLCCFNAVTNFRYIFKRSVSGSDRIITHLSNMIGAGIGAHTAFLLFGASRLISHLLVGYWGLLPWILPGVVGGFIIFVQARRYRPKRVTAT